MASSIVYSAAPYHIISYGTLLGTSIFQSFIAGIVSFRALPRPAFATLQSALFPIYFSMQTALPIIMAFTFPADRTATGMTSSSLTGVLEPEQRYSVLTPLLLTSLCGALNMLVIEPATTKCMRDRKGQEFKDGKKSYDPPPHSKKMQELNSKFMKLHSASSIVNMVGCVATLVYGFYLGGRLL